MRSSTIIASLVALVSTASAGVLPRAEVECNYVTGYGCWRVSNFTETISATGDSHTLSFYAQQGGQSYNTNCTGSTEVGVTCADSAYKVEVDSEATTLTIYQKLYQRSAIAVLGGNATLATACTVSSTGSSVCTQNPFNVQSNLVGTIFSDGTSEGYTF